MHVGVRGQLEMLVLNHSLAFVASVCAFVCESLLSKHAWTQCGYVCMWTGSPVQVHMEARGWCWVSFPPTFLGQHPMDMCPSPLPHGNTGNWLVTEYMWSVWLCGWWGSNSGLPKFVLQELYWLSHLPSPEERIFWMIGVSYLVLDRGCSGVYSYQKLVNCILKVCALYYMWILPQKMVGKLWTHDSAIYNLEAIFSSPPQAT